MSDAQTYPEPDTCPDCAALQARLRTLDAKLAAARLALAACAECPVCSGSAPRPQWITDLFESGTPDE